MAENGLQLRWGEQMVERVRAGRMTRRDLLRRGTVFGLSVTTIGQLLAACSDDGGGGEVTTGTTGGGDGGERSRGGTLRLGAFAPAQAVEPVAMRDATSIAVVQSVMEYLAWLEADFTLRPVLATGWQPAEEGRQWTFTLRDGVTFSDGTPLDEAAVVATFERLLDPANTSAALSAFSGILSTGGVAPGADGTVVFTLDRPFSDFPYIAGAGNYNTVITKADYAMDFSSGGAIGTGPFLLGEVDQTTGASLTRNDAYWDDPKPYLDGVEMTWFADDQAANIALQSDEVDMLLTAEQLLAGALEADPDLTVATAAGTGLTALNMRVDTPPFDQREVRQAVAFALDRQAIIERLYAGAAELGNDHLFAPLYPAAPTDLPQRRRDLDRVESLLSSVGLTPGDVTVPLTFDLDGSTFPQVVRSQLEEAGFVVELEGLRSDVFYGGDQDSDSPWLFRPVVVVEWAGRAVPSQFLVPMVTSEGVWNTSKYANPVVDAAIAAYDAATSEEEKAAQAEIIATALHEDVPVIITYFGGAVRAYDTTRFVGLAPHPSQYVDLADVAQA